MIPEITILHQVMRFLRERLTLARVEPEAGYSTEAVIVIALLAAMAIAAVGIIATKVIAKANSVDTGP